MGGWGNRPRGVCLSRPVPHVLLHTRPPLPAASSCCCFSEEIRFDILITLLPQNWFPFNPTDFFSCSVYKDHIPTKFHGLLQSWGWRWGGVYGAERAKNPFQVALRARSPWVWVLEQPMGPDTCKAHTATSLSPTKGHCRSPTQRSEQPENRLRWGSVVSTRIN